MPPHSAPRIMMGDRLDTILDASRRNQNERRIVMIQAVLQRR